MIKIVAQFHEWMTGVGVLYLKNKVPQVGTVLTTHATVVGRSIAGNGLPLYRDMEIYDGDGMASQVWDYLKTITGKTFGKKWQTLLQPSARSQILNAGNSLERKRIC